MLESNGGVLAHAAALLRSYRQDEAVLPRAASSEWY